MSVFLYTLLINVRVLPILGQWEMLSTLQLITLLPLINVDFPSNAKMFYFYLQGASFFQYLPKQLLPFTSYDEGASADLFTSMDIF